MNPDPTPQPNALASVPPNQWHPKVGDWFILKGSYCGSGNERGCTDASPCADCLAMSNRFIIAGEHYGTFFFNPQFCTRGDGCRLDETCCSVLYTGDIVPKLLPKEGPATHISECLFLAPIAQPADAATAQESMDVLDQPERSFDTYAAKLQKLLKEARDIAAETLIESMKRAQEITALKDQLSTAEKKARELGAALARLQSDWNSGYEAGLQDAEKEQKGCQSEGDTHGLNFHQGRWHGLVAADLILQPLFKLLPPTPSQEQAGGATLNDSSSLEAPVPDTHRAALNAPGQATRDRQVSNQPSGLCEQSLPADSQVETLATSDRERSASPAVTPAQLAGEGAAWSPMESAPKDGSEIIMKGNFDRTKPYVRVIGKWFQWSKENAGCWSAHALPFNAVGWAHLPSPAPAPGTGADTEGAG